MIRVLIVLVALVAAACGDAPQSTAPTSLEASLSPSITVPASVVAQTQFEFACPRNPPGTATVPIIVNANGNPTVVVTNVVVRFSDTLGQTMPQVTIPAPVPQTLFGTALDNARQTTIFPIEVRFGCGTLTVGKIAMTVHTIDAMGHAVTKQLTVAVR